MRSTVGGGGSAVMLALVAAGAWSFGPATRPAGAQDPPGNHFQCYEIRPPGSFERTGLTLVDRFGTSDGVSTER